MQTMSDKNHPNQAEYNPMPADPIAEQSAYERLKAFFFGYDVFISYSRGDALKYSLKLANRLTKLGFTCYLDQLGSSPGKQLPDGVKNAVRKITAFVLIGSAEAGKSAPVGEEIDEYLGTGRSVIIPIDFEGSILLAKWLSKIDGVARAPESTKALELGRPTREVTRRITDSANFTRRNKRLNRVFWSTLAGLLILIGISAYAVRQATAAVKARSLAEDELGRAGEKSLCSRSFISTIRY